MRSCMLCQNNGVSDAKLSNFLVCCWRIYNAKKCEILWAVSFIHLRMNYHVKCKKNKFAHHVATKKIKRINFILKESHCRSRQFRLGHKQCTLYQLAVKRKTHWRSMSGMRSVLAQGWSNDIKESWIHSLIALSNGVSWRSKHNDFFWMTWEWKYYELQVKHCIFKRTHKMFRKFNHFDETN